MVRKKTPPKKQSASGKGEAPRATRDRHPAVRKSSVGAPWARPPRGGPVTIPREGDVELPVAGKTVKLTNLSKLFWPELGLTKADLLQYYADVSAALLPHLK